MRRIVPVVLALAACGKPSAPPTVVPDASVPAPDPRTPAEPESASTPKPVNLGPGLAAVVEVLHVPGMGAAVVDRERVIAIGVAGLRRADQPEPIHTDDRFHLGSDTKAMTAYLVGRLVDQGTLAWDDTLSSSFPGADAWMHKGHRATTLDQLLVHRGGLQTNVDDADLREIFKPEVGPAQQRLAIAKLTLKRKPERPAGGSFSYSNLGYIVLGAALQERTGTTWEALMQREVFDPLEMRSCGFGPVGSPETPQAPWAHAREGDTYRPLAVDNPAFLGPAGTVHCSLEDWGRFARAMFDDAEGLEPATLAHLRTVSSDKYARGWLVSDAFGLGEPVLTHDGSNTFNYASIVIAPHRGLALMTACNAGDEVAQRAAVEAMVGLLKRYAN